MFAILVYVIYLFLFVRFQDNLHIVDSLNLPTEDPSVSIFVSLLCIF